MHPVRVVLREEVADTAATMSCGKLWLVVMEMANSEVNRNAGCRAYHTILRRRYPAAAHLKLAEADSELIADFEALTGALLVRSIGYSLCFCALEAIVGSPAACGPFVNVRSIILSDDRSVPRAWFAKC
jgi:hypothetical protein